HPPKSKKITSNRFLWRPSISVDPTPESHCGRTMSSSSMAVVMDALHRPSKPVLTPSSSSTSASLDRSFNYNNHLSSRFLPLPITTTSSFTSHRITSQLPVQSSKSEYAAIVVGKEATNLDRIRLLWQWKCKSHGCSWMQDNSTYKDIVVNNGRRQGPFRSVFPSTPAEVSSVKDLFEFICSGPLMDKLGFTQETVANSIDKWLEKGFHVCQLFNLNELYLTTPQKARIYHYYIPVYLWCEQQISDHRSTFKEGDDIPPLVIGFSAPQGCGKTTLVFALDYLFRTSGRRLFLNPQFRGNAGSHDLSLSVETLTALGKLSKEGLKMKLPRYDKSAYKGRGDRADPSTWPEVEGPLTVVLFEGWMLGFKPVPGKVVKAIDPQLEIVNKNLEAYYDAWDKFIKSWIVIKIKDPSCVYQWRLQVCHHLDVLLQAEIAMREAGNPGMSDEEVMDFVSRYLPAYKAYLPTLYTEGPKGSDSKRTLVVEIDEERNPILAG
ncbi:hypothetical protein Ccrd_023773, partial [Cynara cardunculus var. scolymus]